MVNWSWQTGESGSVALAIRVHVAGVLICVALPEDLELRVMYLAGMVDSVDEACVAQWV